MENLLRDDAKKTRKRKKAAKATLSFAMDDEDNEDGDLNNDSDTPAQKRSKLKKNPHVDTSFLPDREREEAERKERERLRLEWLTNQENIKQEEIEIVYSFWDGSGHRKSVTVSVPSPFPKHVHNLTNHIFSARKVTRSGLSLKSVETNFQNCAGLALIISCMSRYVYVSHWTTQCADHFPGGFNNTPCTRHLTRDIFALSNPYSRTALYIL